MKTATWLVITVAAALTAGGLIVAKPQAAERAPGAQRHLRGPLLERAKEKLGLTDEQVAQIKAQLKGEQATLGPLLTRLHQARSGLREAIQQADATEASVRAAAAKVAAVEADVAVERLKLFGKISPILTAGQREKVKQFQARRDDWVDRIIARLGERLAE